MYEIPKDDNIGMVTITKDYVEKKGGPLITMRGCAAIEESQQFKGIKDKTPALL